MSKKMDIKNLKIMHHITDRDFLGYRITRHSVLTRHHIIKKVHYEIDDITNYALLTVEAHTKLHQIESTNQTLYNRITDFFLETKRDCRVLDDSYYSDLEKVLRR